MAHNFEHLKIQLEAIKSATNNFANESCIGRGGFGRVYKGKIGGSDGQTMVAVKRLDPRFGQGVTEFWKEVMLLSQYKHNNIVSLLGFCDECGEKILVYEYVPNQSLDHYINNDKLRWIRRLKICISAAHGLAYLHNAHGAQQRVLHRDIKSANILLDENWNAKISDFGLSKLGPANQEYTFLYSHPVGTLGYVDPLYAETGYLTKESDVYSFGVVLFEVLCGRLCIGYKNVKHLSFAELARQSFEQNIINEIVYVNMKDEIDPKSLQAFAKIAYQCLKRDPDQRPLMSHVVGALETALCYQELKRYQVSNAYLPPEPSMVLESDRGKGVLNLKSGLSVVGFDIGNENCVIAAVRNREIDVLLNDESSCETPAVVAFCEKQRFFGTEGASLAWSYPKSTISQVKRLIGRAYRNPDVQKDIKLLPFKTSEAPNGGVLIHLQYLNEQQTFTPVQILAMLFAHLKQIAEKNLEIHVTECVIGIPSYFTDLQRREYLDAAHLAGLTPLRLMHDCTAIALGYGFYKNDFSDTGPTNVVFVDIGHCDTQVTVAAFEKRQFKILSHSFDNHLGGRDFDEVLFRYFAEKFKEQYNIDVYMNTQACVRLRKACEKLKKHLSAYREAVLELDRLMDETDVREIIKREVFENLCLDLFEKVTFPCVKAVYDAGIQVDKIYAIELVGSGSRIPAIRRKLADLFGTSPRGTLNDSECVARGCAAHCAILSPVFLHVGYQFEDKFLSP